MDTCVSIGNVARSRAWDVVRVNTRDQLNTIRFDNIDTSTQTLSRHENAIFMRLPTPATHANANIANHNHPAYFVICLAALAMRRRSRSVPRDAHEREQIVGLHVHKTLKSPAVETSTSGASGNVARTNNTAKARTPNCSKPANIPDSLMPQKAFQRSINVTRQ